MLPWSISKPITERKLYDIILPMTLERHYLSPATPPSRDIPRPEQRRNFLERIDSAYDLSSIGIGIHLHAVDYFANGRDLPNWAEDSVTSYSSNYLSNPYISDWTEDAWSGLSGNPRPSALSPYSKKHLQLLTVTREQYDRLERMQMRLVLGGSEALLATDPRAPISKEEYLSLLLKAKERGPLQQYETSLLLELEPAESAWSLTRSFYRRGVDSPVDLMAYWDSIRLSQDFRQETLQAALRKLGCMMAVTDQITFDAEVSGVPVPASYKPKRHLREWETNWQNMFGQPMPTIGELYQQAHAVLVQQADPNDPVIAHLFPMDQLPQLVA